MNVFRLIGQAIITAVTLGDRLYIPIVSCEGCGSSEPKLDRMKNRRWIVFCPRCRKRIIEPTRTRRRAKMVWRDMNDPEK